MVGGAENGLRGRLLGAFFVGGCGGWVYVGIVVVSPAFFRIGGAQALLSLAPLCVCGARAFRVCSVFCASFRGGICGRLFLGLERLPPRTA